MFHSFFVKVLTASRRAHQKLDRECKRTASLSLKKVVIREREAHDARGAALECLEAAVLAIDLNQDEAAYVAKFCNDDVDDALLMCSQALTALGDLTVNSSSAAGSGSGSGTSVSSGHSSRSPSPSQSNSSAHGSTASSASSGSSGSGSSSPATAATAAVTTANRPLLN